MLKACKKLLALKLCFRYPAAVHTQNKLLRQHLQTRSVLSKHILAIGISGTLPTKYLTLLLYLI